MSRLLSVSVPDELLAETERLALSKGVTKSDLVREALRRHLRLEGFLAVQSEVREHAERLGIGPEDVGALIDDLRGIRG
ncbi:MAG: ribbon-helix-helix protein, CopG family [Solirubrobacteraceae bacterium]